MSVDKTTNSLIVLAQEHDFFTLRDLIQRLDIPRRQVFVEADILRGLGRQVAQPGVAWHGGSTINTGGQQSLLFGGSEPSSDVTRILFSPAALSGLAAGLRGPPIPAPTHPRAAAGHVDPELRRVPTGSSRTTATSTSSRCRTS